MSIDEFEHRLNEWGASNTPFLFYVDFELQRPVAIPLRDVDATSVRFDFNDVTNHRSPAQPARRIELQVNPLSRDGYQRKFQTVLEHLYQGNSFLTNLTIKTPVTLNVGLDELFDRVNARYKLMVRNEFVVFSPETFVKIRDGKISTYPMKGTIPAAFPDAANRILSDVKELSEHVTIVDLLRNDLSVVADNVSVVRFRYIDEIETHKGILLQVSSEITGSLRPELRSKLGTILVALLPAGSVSGAPKRKTLEIIAEVEGEKRGYYTGVCGIYDGEALDSGVMIRFIENSNGRLFYRSGGGITTQSVVEMEYQEMLDKLYVAAT